MKVDGRCHCGRITFEAEIDPAKVLICHCTDCQTLAGSAFRTVVRVPPDAFRLLSGQPKVYVKTAESGNRRAQAFCPDCGSRLWAAAEFDTPVYNLRLGGVRQRAQFAPKAQVWCRSALPWSMDLTGVTRIERQ